MYVVGDSGCHKYWLDRYEPICASLKRLYSYEQTVYDIASGAGLAEFSNSLDWRATCDVFVKARSRLPNLGGEFGSALADGGLDFIAKFSRDFPVLVFYNGNGLLGNDPKPNRRATS